MGQRTQIIHIIQDHKGELRQVDLFHNQWGFGKVMPLALIAYLTNQYNQELPSPSVEPVKGDDGEVMAGEFTPHKNCYKDELSFLTEVANLTQAVRLPFVAWQMDANGGARPNFSNFSNMPYDPDKETLAFYKAQAKALLKSTLGEMASVVQGFDLDNDNGYLILVTTLMPIERWKNSWQIMPLHTSLFIDERGVLQSASKFLAPFKGTKFLSDNAYTNIVAMLENTDMFPHREVMGVLNDDDCQLTTPTNEHEFAPFTPANVLKLFDEKQA